MPLLDGMTLWQRGYFCVTSVPRVKSGAVLVHCGFQSLRGRASTCRLKPWPWVHCLFRDSEGWANPGQQEPQSNRERTEGGRRVLLVGVALASWGVGPAR